MRPELAKQELESLLSDWLETSMGRRVFLSSVGLLLASCASAPKTRYREGDNTGQDTHLSVEDEQRLTREVLPEMQKQYPAVRDSELQQYLSDLGNKIVAANQLDGQPYRYNFTVVDVPFVNAFALPAGTVFVTAPLLQMAESEAELAGVIGHEIGHIKARHTAERMAKAEREKGKSLWYSIGGGVLGGALGYGAGRLACPPKDQKCLIRAAELGAVAGVGGGLLIQKFKFMANSREDEMEADRIGFRTSVRAGYDKDHVGIFYSKLLKMEQDAKRKQTPVLTSVTDAMSTHPPSKERVQQMRLLAAETPSSNSVISTNQFDRARRRAAQFGKKQPQNG